MPVTLDPDAAAVYKAFQEAGRPAYETLTALEAREYYRNARVVMNPEPPALESNKPLSIPAPHGAIPARIYTPKTLRKNDGLAPCLVFFHGGGWVIGDLDTHEVVCQKLCNLSGCALVAVDYRMGPEHRFPAAVDDALAAARWVHGNAATLQVDPSRLAVGGDSAGGNLAAAVALAGGDEGELPIAFQLLIYPATDQRRGAPSHTSNGQGYLLTRDTMAYFHDHYIDDPRHDLDWRASPLLHSDLSGLPPALVLTAGFDPLRDEGMAYAEALTAAGNRAACVCFERQIHGFITMGKVLDEADTAIALCSAELRRALASA